MNLLESHKELVSTAQGPCVFRPLPPIRDEQSHESWLAHFPHQTEVETISCLDIDHLHNVRLRTQPTSWQQKSAQNPDDWFADEQSLPLERFLNEVPFRRFCLQIRSSSPLFLELLQQVLLENGYAERVILSCRHEGAAEILTRLLPKAIHCLPFAASVRILLNCLNQHQTLPQTRYSMITLPAQTNPTQMLSSIHVSRLKANGLWVNIPVSHPGEVSLAQQIGADGLVLMNGTPEHFGLPMVSKGALGAR